MSPRRAERYDTTQPAFAVWMHAHQAGAIGEHAGTRAGERQDDVWFRYVDGYHREAISLRMPVHADTYGHRETLVFFDNLLLESDTRDELARLKQQDRSDVVGLLGRVGGECAGAVSVWAHDEALPTDARYRRYSHAELVALFDERHGERLTAAMLESRQVMSGVQRKLVLTRWNDAWYLPLDGAPSTHIIKRASGRYDGLVANELACLAFYRALGLNVPNAEPVAHDDDGPSLIAVERFDRVVSTRSAGDSQDDTPPRIVKWHQEDLCQLTGRLPRRKYQRDGGPGVRDVADTIRRFSGLPGPDLRDLLTALIANVCLGNGDAHGKNFALLHTPNGVRLSPFYDIVSTEIYPALSPDLSMKFGHTYLPHALSANDVKRFATDLGMAPAAVREAIEHVTTALTSVCDAVLDETTALVGGESDALVRLRALMRVRVPAVEALARKA